MSDWLSRYERTGCARLPGAVRGVCAASTHGMRATGSGESETQLGSSRIRAALAACTRARAGATLHPVLCAQSSAEPETPVQGYCDPEGQQPSELLSVQASVGSAPPRRTAQTASIATHRRMTNLDPAVWRIETTAKTIGSPSPQRQSCLTLRAKLFRRPLKRARLEIAYLYFA